jgi:hypothetical protein
MGVILTRFPKRRQQFSELVDRQIGQALQYIHQVLIGIDALQFTTAK